MICRTGVPAIAGAFLLYRKLLSCKVKTAPRGCALRQIPDDACRPVDKRVTSGKYIKRELKEEIKPLPIGISDYVRAQSEYYYVDKTLLIKEFLDQKPLVSLFTRPRRFGKTLNMDMLRVFFEISEENTAKYFVDKKIWRCGAEYRAHQGKYPVIFLTFKDVKFDTWEATLDKIRGLLQEEYGRHQELITSDRLVEYEKEYFLKILNGNASEVELTSSLERLSKMLCTYYNRAPIVIIDEYDTPIQEGYSKDFYEEIIGFMRNFFSGAFKDNKNLSYGFLTGILRIAQESIFSGLNNLTVSSVMDEEYDNCFGFTETEVQAMLEYYKVPEKKKELREWYDGYLFGKEDIYNPWSVINYISRGCIPQAYWVNTGKNEILSHLLQIGAITRTTANKIAESLFTNDHSKLQKAIGEYMDKSISFYDAGAEGFYHGLVLGLIALMDNQYKITSNWESGDGRYDISMFPREARYPGIIMELKWQKDMDIESLDVLADEALDQIDDRRYDADMKNDGMKDILKFGIAFSGKKVSVKMNR